MLCGLRAQRELESRSTGMVDGSAILVVLLVIVARNAAAVDGCEYGCQVSTLGEYHIFVVLDREAELVLRRILLEPCQRVLFRLA